jgi:hypothetical protein
MIQRALKLDRSPSAALSLRFFLTAPLFAMLAGAVLFWEGESGFASRWSPAALAATHLFTLGVLTMVIAGALLQLLPVVAGAAFPCAQLSTSVMHAALSVGALLLAGAFWRNAPLLFALALPALLLALAWLLAACGVAVWRAPPAAAAAMVNGVRLALAALAPAMLAGAAMVAALAWQLPFPFVLLTDLHAMWALLGWVGMLLIGVAWQVIPMFQITPLYPPAITRVLGIALPALLLASSAAQLAEHPSAAPLRALLFGVFVLFALTTLALLARRKRPADSGTWFWRLSMASLLASVLAWYAPFDAPARPLLPGVLFMLGFAGSAVNGMLYKIVPFLLWHHWQEQGFGRPVPSIRLLIPEPHAMAQFWSHAVALGLLALATLWPRVLLRPAAAALLLSNLWLGMNLLRAARCRIVNQKDAAQ